MMKKIPLLLLPGLLSDADVFQYQAAHLQNVEIIIPNLNQADSPEKMVEAALHQAPTYFALAGHSMGGWVALEIMKHASERVLGLALINTTALPDSPEKYQARKAMIAQAETGDYAPLIDKLVKAFVYKTDIADSARSMFERNQLAFIAQEKAMLKRDDCIEVLGRITCPTLIVHAQNDANFHIEDSELLAEKIKSAQLSVIENCGHMSPMEAPLELTQLLQNWLSHLSDPSSRKA